MKKFARICFLIAAIALAMIPILLLTGCASAHKRAETVHEIERYENGKLVSREIFSDRYKGGGIALLADPKASALASGHTNQTALGGSSSLSVGEISSVVSTNGIKATGEAAGQFGEMIIKSVK